MSSRVSVLSLARDSSRRSTTGMTGSAKRGQGRTTPSPDRSGFGLIPRVMALTLPDSASASPWATRRRLSACPLQLCSKRMGLGADCLAAVSRRTSRLFSGCLVLLGALCHLVSPFTRTVDLCALLRPKAHKSLLVPIQAHKSGVSGRQKVRGLDG